MSDLKLYLRYEDAAYAPTTKRGAWDALDPDDIVQALDTTKSGSSSVTFSAASSEYQANYDVMILRATYVLAADAAFSGTVSGVLGVSQTGALDNVNLHVHMFVTQGQSDTLRGTLLTDHIDTGYLTGTTTCGQAFSAAGGDVAAFAGDVLVVEIGARNITADSKPSLRAYFGGAGADLANGGDGTVDTGWLQFTYVDPAAPDNPTITAPNGGESWREGSTHNLTTAAVPSQSQGYACAFEYEFSAAGDFTDAVDIVNAITAASYAWLLPYTLVAADTATCKVRVRAYVIGSPAVVSSWDASDVAFAVGNSTAPTTTLVTPLDTALLPGLSPTFIFGTADTESDPVHVVFQASAFADFRDFIIDTDSAVDYADWEEAASPFSSWTAMGSGGATAGNEVRYTGPDPFRYDTYYGRVKLKDTYSTAAWTTFTFTISVDATVALSVTIGGTAFNVGVCRIVENTGGEASPVDLQITLAAYLAHPLTKGDAIAISSGLGDHNRSWNGTLESRKFSGTVVDIHGVQDDAYLSRKLATGNESSADIGQNLADFITSYGTPITGTNIDVSTGLSAALTGGYKSIREHLGAILKALPQYIAWVDSGGDLHFVDQGDLAAPTYAVFEEDPTYVNPVTPFTAYVGWLNESAVASQVDWQWMTYEAISDCALITAATAFQLLPDVSFELTTLDVSNKVFVVVKGSSPLTVGSATNTTVAPTYANSPRETIILVDSGDATYCNAVAAGQLAFTQEERKNLSGLPVRLRDGLAIERGTMLEVVSPRTGISGNYPVRRLEHDWGSNTTLIDVGEFATPRDDPAMLFEIAAAIAQLAKEQAI